MKAIQPLMTEYEDIKGICDVLGTVYQQSEASGDMKRDHLDAITEYLKVFLDKYQQPGMSMNARTAADRLPH